VGVWERSVHGDASDDLLAGGRRGDERSRGRPSGRPFCLAYVARVGLLIAREPERARLPELEPCGGDGGASGDGESSGDDGAPPAPEARGLPKPFRRGRR
jgi:hypothetical protein